MLKTRQKLLIKLLLVGLVVLALFIPTRAGKIFNVRSLGAVGDGKNLDGPIIDKAIKDASTEAVKDGTINIVLLPAGDYRSFTIHGQSNIQMRFEKGATLIAADPRDGDGKYDPPEPNKYDQYQDFGHSHWHNSLIVGENIENFSIVGPGVIWGKGLVAYGNESRTREQNTAIRSAPPVKTPFGYPNPQDTVEIGWADKAIALKNCHKVHIGEGLSILYGGHFGILATGVDGLIIDKAVIDTNRDGIDIDVSSNVVISNTRVNSPNDDAIVFKSSMALGAARATENVIIINSKVSGEDEGAILGTPNRQPRSTIAIGGPNGRIKLGTESAGGFKNINILDCEFEYSRGLAIEIVDGGLLDGFTASRIKMRDVLNSPIFIRLGNRGRSPKNTASVGTLRNVLLCDFNVRNADSTYASIISGIPGHLIDGVTLRNIDIQYRGDGTKEDATLEPPEKESDYPEPAMFGTIPASGFYIRHAQNVRMSEIHLSFIKNDLRPIFILNDVEGFKLTDSAPLLDMILDGKIKSKTF